MKIRSVLELSDALDGAVAWRKKELSALRTMIASRDQDHEQAALRRAAVPLLYAHWEGFAKQAATYYLELVVRQRLKYRELATCFVALAARGRIRQAAAARRLSAHMPVVHLLLYGLDEATRFSVDGAIDTESNLSSSVLRDLLATIDLPYDTRWSSKELLIDGSLLKTRNDVAHGERRDVDAETYEQLHALVVELLDHLKRSIESSAVMRGYLRSPTPRAPSSEQTTG
jgi:hypothetical protein